MTKHVELNHSLEKYIIDHSNKLDPVLREIVNYNTTLGDKKKLQISISQAQFLQTLIKISNIKKVLEIGSFTGFSALSMAISLPDDGSLTSLDKNIEFSKKAKKFYEKANEGKIIQIIKPALESLEELKNSNRKFDLVFIDADKENYENYFNLSLYILKKGGFILIDNVLWKGDVIDPTKNDKLTNIIRKFNSFIKRDDRIEKTILPLGDGITICRKI